MSAYNYSPAETSTQPITIHCIFVLNKFLFKPNLSTHTILFHSCSFRYDQISLFSSHLLSFAGLAAAAGHRLVTLSNPSYLILQANLQPQSRGSKLWHITSSSVPDGGALPVTAARATRSPLMNCAENALKEATAPMPLFCKCLRLAGFLAFCLVGRILVYILVNIILFKSAVCVD